MPARQRPVLVVYLLQSFVCLNLGKITRIFTRKGKKIMFIRFNEIFFRLQFFCACLYLSAHAQNSRRRQIQSL